MPNEPRSSTILLVEPDLLVCQPLAEYLRECGYKVLEAMNRDEAIRIVKESDRHINILLSDVHTPGTLDGFGLANWIKATRPDLDIILAGTALEAAEEAHTLCEEGPKRSRPANHAILLDKIKQRIAARAGDRAC